ncbi:Demethylmenaquinone methyltransferase [Roseivivax sp. THAF40]|uniref:methyltransferase domain-containing protein n=1 Tax=unclassified Roseivivax TaxID=2639302 RepID=UPI001267E683|nr:MULTISPECIES: methyltransferase domain-containing protein [unclassified Roseivivax]QFS84560.1 Demethylmenaquinone methyltransferase [Roseivivax sp. THAF197b]QFT48387.1 Demethylmenaquinone methyltransferase [Roseivivax sp. THAF40]
MLAFDAKTAALLNRCYLGADFAHRRRVNFDAILPAPGDCIADIGCGNGMLTVDLSRAVGPDGHIFGIEPSPDMRSTAQSALHGMDNVSVLDGTAEALPLDDASCDKAVSVQVLEYVPDLDAALREVERVLKPGGVVAVGDMHFGTFTWASDDPARMNRMLRAWDSHVAHVDLPASLPACMARAGLTVETVRAVPMTDHLLRPDGMAAMLLILMRNHAIRISAMTEEEADAWQAEQQTRAAQDTFFFSLTHFVIVGRKP